MKFLKANRRAAFLAIVLPGLLFADQITLKNGDRVSGKITTKDGKKVTIESELLGKVTVDWDAVTVVTSDGPLTVVLPDGKSVVGKLRTDDGKLEVATPAAVESAALAQVSAIRDPHEQRKYERLQAPSWLDLWAGYVDLGFAAARGNAKTNTLNTAFTATRATRTDKTTLYFNQIYAKASVDQKSSATANAVRGGWSYDRNLSRRLFLNTFNDYEFDQFQNLDLRFVLGGGLGFSVIKGERSRLDLLGGVDYQRESFNTPLTRNSAEAFWGNDFNYKLTAKAALRQSFRMFDNLTDRGEYRMNFDLGADTSLWKWLSWQLTASDRFLSVPAAGRQRNDILITTGFRVNFAR